LEIADCLRGLSLERDAETFRDNANDVAVLPELSEADLEKARRPPRPSQDHAEGDRSASWRRGRKHCGACAGIGSDPTVADESGCPSSKLGPRRVTTIDSFRDEPGTPRDWREQRGAWQQWLSARPGTGLDGVGRAV
jgi:hypothetical protein